MNKAAKPAASRRNALRILMAGQLGQDIARERGVASAYGLVGYEEGAHIVVGCLTGNYAVRAFIEEANDRVSGTVEWIEADQLEEADARDDSSKISEIAETFSLAEEVLDIDQLQRETREMLCANWIAVWAVARELIDRLKLEGDQIRAILQIAAPALVAEWPEETFREGLGRNCDYAPEESTEENREVSNGK